VQKAVAEAAPMGGHRDTRRPAHDASFVRDEFTRRWADIRTVQERLGHRDVGTTMTYLHVMNRGALAVQSPMDRL
jgi:integrase